MNQIAVLCNCGKSYNVPADKAGKRFKCVACGESLVAAAPAPEPAAAPQKTSATKAAPRPSAARRPAKEAAPKKSPMPLILGGVALVAALGVGGYFTFVGKGNSTDTNTNTANATNQTAPKPVEAPKDPLAEKKAELTKKIAEAEKQQNPAAALMEVAAFCLKEPKLEADAKKLYTMVIAKDPENATAHEALGHKKYEGDTADFKGKWIDNDQFTQLTAADTQRREDEEKKRKEEERRANDPFIKNAKVRIAEMQRMIDDTNRMGADEGGKVTEEEKPGQDINKFKKTDVTPAKFKFFYDCKEVPKPYLLAVQEEGFNTPQSWASSFGEILDALRRTFYRRYSPFVKLTDLSQTPVPVWIFRSKGQYERWRRCGNGGPGTEYVAAFYTSTVQNNASGMLYLWLRDSREEKNFEKDAILFIKDTVWHEGTHQLMDYNSPGRGFGAGNMPWMQEGFAEYVGTYSQITDDNKPGEWIYFFGVPNPGRKNEIYGYGKFSDKAQEGDFVEAEPSLRDVVHCNYMQFWAARQMQESKESGTEAQKARQLVSGTYAYGWALCHFLQHYDNGKYRKQFHKWLELELTKQSSGEAFDKLLGLDSDEKWKEFEQNFQDWLCLTMRRDFAGASTLEPKMFKKYMKEFEDAINNK